MKSLIFTLFSTLFIAAGPAVAQNQEAFMVMEANSGKVLVAANSGSVRPVASLTKIATAVIAVDWAEATSSDPAQVSMTVPQVASMLGDQPNPMNLQPGEQITLRDALYSALLGSDNIAALTIADHVGRQLQQARGRDGDPVATFIGEMNQLAKGLGMSNTRFVNPHGLEFPKRVGTSTAADMARLSVYAMRRPTITFMARQKERQISVRGSAGSRSYNVKNTNELIGEPGIIGLKTGTTQAAGPCLSVVADRDPALITTPDGQKKAVPRRLVVVLLNSPDRFNRARGLIGQGWSTYDRWFSAGAPINNRKNEILDVPNLRE